MLLTFYKYIQLWLAKVVSKDPFKPAFLVIKKMAFVTVWSAMWHFHEYYVLHDSQSLTGCWTLCNLTQRREAYVELEVFVMGSRTLHATRSPKCLNMIPITHTSSMWHLGNCLASLKNPISHYWKTYHHGRFALLFHWRLTISQDSLVRW